MRLPWDVVPSHSPTLIDEAPSIGTIDGSMGGNLGCTQALSRINTTDRHSHFAPVGCHAPTARGAVERTNPSLDCTLYLLNAPWRIRTPIFRWKNNGETV